MPWLLVTLLMLVVDLACTGLALTDLQYRDEVTGFTCPDLAADSGTRRTLTILTLVLVFSRGGLVWLLNLSLFISVALLYVRLVTIKLEIELQTKIREVFTITEKAPT